MSKAGSRGSAALQVALVMPAVLLLITAVVQVTEWQHAVHIAQEAANRGVETSRVVGGTDAAGRAAAEQTAAQFSVLHVTQVRATRAAGNVRVEVMGTTSSVVGIQLPIDAVAFGPVETAP